MRDWLVLHFVQPSKVCKTAIYKGTIPVPMRRITIRRSFLSHITDVFWQLTEVYVSVCRHRWVCLSGTAGTNTHILNSTTQHNIHTFFTVSFHCEKAHIGILNEGGRKCVSTVRISKEHSNPKEGCRGKGFSVGKHISYHRKAWKKWRV